MSARSLARAAAALFAVAVLAALVYAAQRESAPVEVPAPLPAEVQPLAAPAEVEPQMLLPTTKSGEAPAVLLLPSTKAAPVRLPQP